MTKSDEKLLIRIFLVIFAIACVGFVFLLVKKSKSIPVSSENNGMAVAKEASELFEEPAMNGVQLEVPLPNSTSDGYVLEQDLREKELTITVYEVESSFYEKNRLKGDASCFSSVTYEYLDGQGVFVFQLNDVYDTKASVVDGQLEISLQRPQAQGSPIVVFEGSDFAMADYSVLKDQGICVLENGDSDVANSVRADFYVACNSIESGTDGASKLTIYYNNRFSIPNFDSYDFAVYLSDYLREKDGNLVIDVAFSEEERLVNAMEPAVYLEYQQANVEDAEQTMTVFYQNVMEAVAACVRGH